MADSTNIAKSDLALAGSAPGTFVVSRGPTQIPLTDPRFTWDETTGTFTADGVSQITVRDSGGQVYNCKAFGARGGGAADDTAAIQAAVDAAGPGGTVLLPRDTYLISSPITVPERVVIRGDRSIIKRANQIVTTTSAPVAIGANTITVTARNGLRVGHYVTVATGVPLPTTGGRVASAGTGYVNGETVTFTGGLAPGGVPATGYITASGGAITGIVIATQGSGYVSSPKPTINTVAGVGGVVVPPWPEPNYDPTSHRILSISGNTLTVLGNFTVGFAAGAAVYTVWNGIASTGGGTRIYDLIMDGSRAGWTFYPWQCVAEMSLTGDRYVVQGCELYESPGEGIIAFGNYNSCLNSWIHNINGNGIHFSGVMNMTVLDVAVVHGNQDQSVGHGYRAGIAWSNDISHVTCIGNYVEDCLNGFGAIKDTSNSEVTLMGNTVVNCWENGISAKATTIDRAPKNIVIVGNRIYQCPTGIIVSHTQNNTTVFPTNVLIADNILDGNATSIALGNARNVSITGNIFIGSTGVTGGITFHVSFSRSKQISIANNTFTGYRYGVYGGDSLTENLRISGNIFTNQYTQSVVIAGAKNCVVTDNILSNDATVISGYIGILAYGSVGITGNKLNLDNTNGGVVGIYLNTAMNTYTSGPNVQGNEIRGTSQNGIRTGEGQAVVANNVLTATTTMRNDTGIVTTPAVLTFTRSGGVITGVTVVSGGSYSVKPNVYAIDTGGSGSGASFSVTMSGAAIASVAVVSGGANYVTPTASISGNFIGTNYQVV